MKKLLSVFVAAGVVMACMSGCADKKKESSQVPQSSIPEVMIPLEMPDIDISVPDSYEETSTDSNTTVFVKSDASIIVNSDVFTENYKTLDEYVDYALLTYQTYSDSVELLNHESDGKGSSLIEFIYSIDTENGIFKKYCMVGFFTDGEKIYLVTCKADVDTYESYREEFLDIIGSVSV